MLVYLEITRRASHVAELLNIFYNTFLQINNCEKRHRATVVDVYVVWIFILLYGFCRV